MSINIQVLVDKTISELRATVKAIDGLSEDTRRSLLETTQLVLESVEDDPDLDRELFKSVLIMNMMYYIASGELEL